MVPLRILILTCLSNRCQHRSWSHCYQCITYFRFQTNFCFGIYQLYILQYFQDLSPLLSQLSSDATSRHSTESASLLSLFTNAPLRWSPFVLTLTSHTAFIVGSFYSTPEAILCQHTFFFRRILCFKKPSQQTESKLTFYRTYLPS